MKHYPMTKEQRETLDRDLITVMDSLGNIAIMLRACYSEDDTQVWRADEARAAVQRLLWALERQAHTAARANGA